MATEEQGCKQIFALLSEYLDRELPPGDCREMEKHLAGCPPCIEFVNSLKRTIGLCRGYQPDAPPGPLDEHVREELLAAYRRMVAAPKAG
jgi:RNA polymerase sigma-70 factor, ECF subfamily